MATVLRGALVVDGSGSPAERADVAIEGGRIVSVGDRLPPGDEEVDLSGLVLAPGFIDPHTHYDAQVFWDPDLTPSGWHGVTTVVTGNCGFTLAPTRPEHRETIVLTLEQVEGMSADALRAGLDWGFETFPEYLEEVDRRPKRLNVACMIGHTALRWYVVGDEATERPARPDETAAMRRLVAEAIDRGAVGLSSSRHNHVGAHGQPVPSRLADRDEMLELAGGLRDAGRGAMEVALGEGFGIADALEVAGYAHRPLTWSGAVLVPPAGFGGAEAAARAVDDSQGVGTTVMPQFPSRPIVNLITLADPFPLRAASDGFLEVLRSDPGGRLRLYADEGWRRRTRAGLSEIWEQRLAAATVEESRSEPGLVGGLPLGEAAGRRGTTPFDLLVELSLRDDLGTRFSVAVANTDEDVITQLLRDPRCLLGLSDAGAHVSQLCDAGYSTHLLGHWVRERGVLPLETAVWRLTGQPASLFGLHDRGRIGVGYAADLVAFDPQTVGSGRAERVRDFPAGTDRLVVRSTGVESVWVNGVAVRRLGADRPGVRPGRLVTAALGGRAS